MKLADLASRHADDTLDESGYDELNQLLQHSRDARDEFRALMRTHALIRQRTKEQIGREDSKRITLLQAQRDQRRGTPRSRHLATRRLSRPYAANLVLTFSLLFCTAGVISWLVFQQQVPPDPAPLNPDYAIIRGDIKGDPVAVLPATVTAQTSATLSHRDGSEYVLTAGSRVTLSSHAITLHEGVLDATVRDQSKSLTFDTASGFRTYVLGTRFSLYEQENKKGINLHEGRVTVEYAGKNRQLTSGDSWLAHEQEQVPQLRPPSPPATVLFVTGPQDDQTSHLLEMEQALRARSWHIIRCKAREIANYPNVDLILITASIRSENFNVSQIQDLALPVVIEELFLAPLIGLSGTVEGRDFGHASGTLTVQDDHPLAANLPPGLARQAFEQRLFANPSHTSGQVFMHIDNQAVCTLWPRGAMLADGSHLAGARATFSLSVNNSANTASHDALCELIAWMLEHR